MVISTRAQPHRRRLLLAVAGAALLPWVAARAAAPAVLVEVWKDPSCGCCKEWVTHLQEHGFKTVVRDVGNNAMRARLGITSQYGSCHTALVGGYAIEGHVPAPDIARLLAQRPAAIGLAAPGMPVGSPGMDGAVYQGRADAYEVLLLTRDGRATVFSKYPARAT